MLDALGKQPNLLRFGVTTAALALGDLLLLRTPLAMRRTASPNGSAIASRLLQLSVPSRGQLNGGHVHLRGWLQEHASQRLLRCAQQHEQLAILVGTQQRGRELGDRDMLSTTSLAASGEQSDV